MDAAGPIRNDIKRSWAQICFNLIALLCAATGNPPSNTIIEDVPMERGLDGVVRFADERTAPMTERNARGGPPPVEINETGTQPSPGLRYVEAAAPYDKEQHVETVRYRIALLLIALLAFMIAGAFALAATERWTRLQVSDILTLLEMILTPVVTLVSAAAGFYFGAQAVLPRRGTRQNPARHRPVGESASNTETADGGSPIRDQPGDPLIGNV